MKKIGPFLGIIPLVVLVFYLIWASGSRPNPPNVILISIDTLRADHLGCYGYERDTSPHLDELAVESVLFENFFAPSSATTPSHVSMLTSLHPLSHGVLSNRDKRAFSEDAVPIARVLKDNGFVTAGFTGGGNVSEIEGFRRGFDFWSEGHNISPHLPEVMNWISQNGANKFFLFFHFYDVHDPYIFREDFRDLYRDPDYYMESVARAKNVMEKTDTKNVTYEAYAQLTAEERIEVLIYHMLEKPEITFEQGVGAIARTEILSHLKEWPGFPEYPKQHQLLVDSYDAGLKYTDHYLGELFDFLKSRDLWTNTMLVVTSDHGEEFMEHNMVGHLLNLYDTLLHVPLIIKMPENWRYSNRRVSSVAEIVDIMPTILDVLDISFDGQMQGKSLLPMMLDNEREQGGMIFATLDNRFKKRKRAVRTSEWKYMIADMDFSDEDEFFHVSKDRFEQTNLIGVGTEEMRELRSFLLEHIRECDRLYQTHYSRNRKTQDDYPEESRKKRLEVLRALGYIN